MYVRIFINISYFLRNFLFHFFYGRILALLIKPIEIVLDILELFVWIQADCQIQDA